MRKTDVITPPSTHDGTLPLYSLYPALVPPVRVRLVVTPEHPCPYKEGRVSRNRALWAEQVPGELYHGFMDAGFRRSGKVLYQPICAGCRACQPIRVRVDRFQPNKSQRRCWRRNADLSVTWATPVPSDEKYDLYRRYVSGWHGKDAGEEDRASFESFLYDSPVQSVEYLYRDARGRLLAVGICDVCEQSLSTVYFYFEVQEAARGLGIFGALYEIEECKRLGIRHYYLGYWIEGSRTMQYKSSFHPHELLYPDGIWRERCEG